MTKASEIYKDGFFSSFDYLSNLEKLNRISPHPTIDNPYPYLNYPLQDNALNFFLEGNGDFALEDPLVSTINPYALSRNDCFFDSYSIYKSLLEKYLNEGDKSNVEHNLRSDNQRTDSISPSNEIIISSESTDSDIINKKNQAFMLFLQERSAQFTFALKMSDFEDGMMNDVVNEFENYLNENEYVTLLWLNILYSQNQQDFEVISALLRIIGLTVEACQSDMLLPIVKCGLADRHPETQEAALMVIERWRTKECLDAILTTNFSSGWINQYAKSVARELKEEIEDVT